MYLLSEDDADYGVGSALDQRGWHHPVETIDGFGTSPRAAVADLNARLASRGLPTFELPTDERVPDERVPDHMAESDRWRFVATHIL